MRRTPIHRTASAAIAALLFTAGLGAPAAMASNLAGGGTLQPVPASTLPAGATLVNTLTKPFSYTATRVVNTPNGPLFFPAPVSGSVTQRIYRLSDNTITFAYGMSNDSDSQAEPTELYVRDFSEYTADVSQYGGLINILTTQSPTRAVRSADGGSVEFDIDAGLTAGHTLNTVYVHTNATAYSIPGRYSPVASRVTVCGGSCTNIYGFGYPVEDSTPPLASITSPAQLAGVCNPVIITGTAYDPSGFDTYDLEYSTGPNGPWTNIHSSGTAVTPAGTLGSWSTTSIAQGYYFIRLTAANTTGMTTSVTTMVYVDKQFDTVDVRSPGAGQVLGGGVCFDGSVNDGNGVSSPVSYTISYAPLPAGAPFLPVNPAAPTYAPGVINDGLGSWLTSSGPAAVADGGYRVKVTGTDHCGNTKSVTRDLIIDNTAPIALISSPATCSSIGTGIVPISASISDLHLAGWSLMFTGGDAHGWVPIASGSNNTSGVIANWNTAGLRPCAYTLRLVAADSSGISCSGNTNQTEYFISVNVGCPGDFNRSGSVSVQDIFDFLIAYFAGCP